MAKLNLTREQLAKFLPDHQSIRAFERVFEEIDSTLPGSSDEANNNAGIAIAAANAALDAVAEIISQLQQVLAAPVLQPNIPYEDYSPALALGTMSAQNADAVDITGGSIDGVSLSNTSGTFVSITYSGQLTSTVATGTAPMIVASTTKVANLNVDLLDGADWANPSAIGSTTPNTGVFTGISTIGGATVGDGNAQRNFIVNGSNSGTGGGAVVHIRNAGLGILVLGNKSAINGGAYDATPYIAASGQIEFNQGIKVPGGAQFISTSTNLNNGAGASTATFTNAPIAGNPTKWIEINDNGTVRYIPAF